MNHNYRRASFFFFFLANEPFERASFRLAKLVRRDCQLAIRRTKTTRNSSFPNFGFALLLIPLSSSPEYDNPVPLLIGETTEIKCDLSPVNSWTFKDKEIKEGKKHKLLDENRVLQIHRTDYLDEGNYTCNSASSSKMFVAKGERKSFFQAFCGFCSNTTN